MPKNVTELRNDDLTATALPDTAQEVLRFLGQEEGKAYDYTEIFEGLVSPHDAAAIAPWSPFLVGLRALNLGVTLDNLNREGYVSRATEGARSWYFLSERGLTLSRATSVRSE